MTPELRATLDRFILDVANTKYIASELPAGAAARLLPGAGRTVSQLFSHLASALERQGQAVEAHCQGSSVAEADEPDAAVAGSPEPVGARLDAALRALVGAASHLTAADLARDYAPGETAIATLQRWARHFSSHALDMSEVLPELRFDPMILNWLLYADYPGDPRRQQQQRRLLEDVRERYAGEDAGEEDDDPDDA